MKRIQPLLFALLIALVGTFVVTGCQKKVEEADVIQTGTYEGTITRVNPGESEIYVDSDGRELELYFKDDTKLTRDGGDVDFSELQKGMKVEVEVERVGQRLDPIFVRIKE